MRVRVAIALGLASLGSVGQAAAQERPSIFDLGIYGGGAYTTDWRETTEYDFLRDETLSYRSKMGEAPIFGATASLFAIPALGVRAHYGFMPADLSDDLGEENRYNHFYDLSLVVRTGPLYAWAGGGGLTTQADGASETVPQATVGIGGDLIKFTPNIGLFAELGANGYEAPGEDVSSTEGGVEFERERLLAVTGRLVAGIKFSLGGGSERVESPRVAAPAPYIPAPPIMLPTPSGTAISVCVVDQGGLREVQAFRVSGDTMVTAGTENRRFAQVFPSVAPDYAASSTWYRNESPITFQNQAYVRYGVTRIIAPSLLASAGEFQGTPVFVESGARAPYAVVYVPVRTGCEFQAYQLREGIRPRG